MGAYDNFIDWLYIYTDPIKEQLRKEIEENETETKSNCTNTQDTAGASLSDTKG